MEDMVSSRRGTIANWQFETEDQNSHEGTMPEFDWVKLKCTREALVGGYPQNLECENFSVELQAVNREDMSREETTCRISVGHYRLADATDTGMPINAIMTPEDWLDYGRHVLEHYREEILLLRSISIIRQVEVTREWEGTRMPYVALNELMNEYRSLYVTRATEEQWRTYIELNFSGIALPPQQWSGAEAEYVMSKIPHGTSERPYLISGGRVLMDDEEDQLYGEQQ